MQQSGIFPNINTPHASTVPDALDLGKLEGPIQFPRHGRHHAASLKRSEQLQAAPARSWRLSSPQRAGARGPPSRHLRNASAGNQAEAGYGSEPRPLWSREALARHLTCLTIRSRRRVSWSRNCAACLRVGVLRSRRSHVVLPGALLQRGQWLLGGTGARPKGWRAQPSRLPQLGAVRDARG